MSCERMALQGKKWQRVASVSTFMRWRGQIRSLASTPVDSRKGGSVRGPSSKLEIDGVDKIIAVSSAKGGVGKSTTAVNLAVALATACRLKVGLLDADVHGPSIPTLMNLNAQPQVDAGLKMIPLQNFGVHCMSMGFLVEKDAPIVWRGPMVMSALEKLTRGVAWGKLDVMVVDMPPGTGDAQISISQRLKLAGAIIVSTPQDIALLDARRGVNMFQKILGLIENMSFFQCPKCGEHSHIFGHGGARATAEEMGMDFLGEVPLNISIRETSDQGCPIVASSPDSEAAGVYKGMAKHVVKKLEDLASSAAYSSPSIVLG
ncbi:hypothetical protein O6H91_01G166600 [Diphasiastrum complanatum]|uniref:Uncharacterized protein n=1 Tax=Diphasiastrum complanatum TaxID=34168 RepID=A0ACC2EYN4_DIPCM|nr:hypothetical protein O6H91_01G166600 [Diphasiastrum complanatum]